MQSRKRTRTQTTPTESRTRKRTQTPSTEAELRPRAPTSIPRTDGGHIVLIGMPGSGKSKLGSCVADQLSVPFYEADAEIEQLAGKTIRKIFAEDGETVFRDLESAVLVDILQKPDGVLSCGGGLVMREQNRLLLTQSNPRYVIYLHADVALLTERLADNDTRPMLSPNPTADRPANSDRTAKQKRISEMLHTRDPVYRACADRILNIDKRLPVAEYAKRLMALLSPQTESR